MNFSYFKFLNYINKHQRIHWMDLTFEFKITNSEAREIVKILSREGYISSVGDTDYQSTYKGKHFIQSAIFSFININIVNILALIVSIIALIFSGIALFR